MPTMKSLQIVDIEKAAIIELPIPKPGPGQVLVKVKAVTTCPQWDLHIFHGKPMFVNEDSVPFPYPPGQPGHEMTGTVTQVGEGCKLQVGQTVCAWKDPGKIRHGSYAEYVVMDEGHLLPIPEHLPYQKVASLELAMCVASSILRIKQTIGISGKRCGVNGLGPAGLIALQLLKAEGASEVIGIDLVEARRSLAVQLGAVQAIAPGSSDIASRGRPGSFDIAIDCVGYPEAVRYLMDHTSEAVALFAVQRHDYILHHPGLTVIGYPGHYREAGEYALDLIIKEKLDLSSLITRELPFEEYPLAVELLRKQEAIKICFVPSLGEA